MTNPNEPVNGTTFVSEEYNAPFIISNNDGLTKREHFAALAMQGLLAKSSYNESVDEKIRVAIKYADTLIKQLNESEVTNA